MSLRGARGAGASTAEQGRGGAWRQAVVEELVDGVGELEGCEARASWWGWPVLGRWEGGKRLGRDAQVG
jgi:hypothetical protein